MKQFAEYHTSETEEEGQSLARTWSVIGIALCVGIFLYLSYVARKAVQEEIEDEEGMVLPSNMSEVNGR